MKITIVSNRNDFVLFATKALTNFNNVACKTFDFEKTTEEDISLFASDVLLIDEELDLKNLSKLIYLLNIYNNENQKEIFKVIINSSKNIDNELLLNIGYDKVIDLNTLQNMNEEYLLSLIQSKRLEERRIVDLDTNPLTSEEEKNIEDIMLKFKLDLILTGSKFIKEILALSYKSPRLLSKTGIDAIIDVICKKHDTRLQRMNRVIIHAIETSRYYSDEKLYQDAFYSNIIPDVPKFIIGLTIELILNSTNKITIDR